MHICNQKTIFPASVRRPLQRLALHLLPFIASLLWALALPAQGGNFHPERHEVGLRLPSAAITFRSYEADEYMQDYHQLGLTCNLYYVGRTQSNTYWRAGLGFGAKETYQAQNQPRYLADGTYRTLKSAHESLLSTELGYGVEFKQLKDAFWSRLRFRAGVVLQGQLQLRETSGDIDEVRDSVGTLIRHSSYSERNTGAINLQIGAAGQLAYRIKGGLFLGMDWMIGPNIEIAHGQLVHSSQVVRPDQAYQSQELLEQSTSSARLVWRNSLRAPTFFVGWAF